MGADAIEVLGLHDVVFEYEITSNRVDCYSVIGIAREAAATFRKEILPAGGNALRETAKTFNDYVKVAVEDPELCPRYCARMVKNIKTRAVARSGCSAAWRPAASVPSTTSWILPTT